MPEEMVWKKKKRKIAYPLLKVGREQLDDESDEYSAESMEKRIKFENTPYNAHTKFAREAEERGWIPEKEEYDEDWKLNETKEDVVEKKKAKKHEREGSVASRISSLF